ncbi:hypothetical protein BB558_005206 [Smittium angustum]|uniref:AB hydrolase-1 domain-containing protein n=1 Tax=Smittium angustum TaxID=133377 RepID=A0A2U1J127_SMIAN|nr:hypothetical protein BB558_005206 [Smittium angustum]
MTNSLVTKDYLYKYNHLVNIVNDQHTFVVDNYTLESGETLKNIPLAYKTWGTLNKLRNNCMVICHAFTGSADVSDWWGPLLGEGRSFDTSRFFVVCVNVLGSPYGSASPLTTNSVTGKPYGPEFPLTTIRDDVNLHRLVLNHLGVKQVAIVIGGSLGGMQVLEWSMFGPEYVKNIVAISTSGRHSAWGISWGEAQRQTIYSDPNYNYGYYTLENSPKTGLSVARMSALLTYRSRNSFELRFGRKDSKVHPDKVEQYRRKKRSSQTVSISGSESDTSTKSSLVPKTPLGGVNQEYFGLDPETELPNDDRSASKIFSAQSYLRYQGEKFINRFDANCYIALAKKMDTHDIGRGRGDYFETLESIKQPALVVGIESDGLFTFNEQIELAENIPNARLARIDSGDGHDGFLLEFEQLNKLIRNFISEQLPELYNPYEADVGELSEHVQLNGSVFGEVDPNLAKW